MAGTEDPNDCPDCSLETYNVDENFSIDSLKKTSLLKLLGFTDTCERDVEYDDTRIKYLLQAVKCHPQHDKAPEPQDPSKFQKLTTTYGTLLQLHCMDTVNPCLKRYYCRTCNAVDDLLVNYESECEDVRYEALFYDLLDQHVRKYRFMSKKKKKLNILKPHSDGEKALFSFYDSTPHPVKTYLRRERDSSNSPREEVNMDIEHEDCSAEPSGVSKEQKKTSPHDYVTPEEEISSSGLRRRKKKSKNNDSVVDDELLKKCRLAPEEALPKLNIVLPKEMIATSWKDEIEKQRLQQVRRSQELDKISKDCERAERERAKKEKRQAKKAKTKEGESNQVFLSEELQDKTPVETANPSPSSSSESDADHVTDPGVTPDPDATSEGSEQTYADKHLSAFWKLLEEQPKRHTLQQQQEERRKARDVEVERQREELNRLREDKQKEQASKPSSPDARQIMLRKLQEKERLRNMEEEQDMQGAVLNKTKYAKEYAKTKSSVLTAWSPDQLFGLSGSSNHGHKAGLMPGSKEEEEAMYKFALELSKKTSSSVQKPVERPPRMTKEIPPLPSVLKQSLPPKPQQTLNPDARSTLIQSSVAPALKKYLPSMNSILWRPPLSYAAPIPLLSLAPQPRPHMNRFPVQGRPSEILQNNLQLGNGFPMHGGQIRFQLPDYSSQSGPPRLRMPFQPTSVDQLLQPTVHQDFRMRPNHLGNSDINCDATADEIQEEKTDMENNNENCPPQLANLTSYKSQTGVQKSQIQNKIYHQSQSVVCEESFCDSLGSDDQQSPLGDLGNKKPQPINHINKQWLKTPTTGRPITRYTQPQRDLITLKSSIIDTEPRSKNQKPQYPLMTSYSFSGDTNNSSNDSLHVFREDSKKTYFDEIGSTSYDNQHISDTRQGSTNYKNLFTQECGNEINDEQKISDRSNQHLKKSGASKDRTHYRNPQDKMLVTASTDSLKADSVPEDWEDLLSDEEGRAASRRFSSSTPMKGKKLKESHEVNTNISRDSGISRNSSSKSKELSSIWDVIIPQRDGNIMNHIKPITQKNKAKLLLQKNNNNAYAAPIPLLSLAPQPRPPNNKDDFIQNSDFAIPPPNVSIPPPTINWNKSLQLNESSGQFNKSNNEQNLNSAFDMGKSSQKEVPTQNKEIYTCPARRLITEHSNIQKELKLGESFFLASSINRQTTTAQDQFESPSDIRSLLDMATDSSSTVRQKGLLQAIDMDKNCQDRVEIPASYSNTDMDFHENKSSESMPPKSVDERSKIHHQKISRGTFPSKPMRLPKISPLDWTSLSSVKRNIPASSDKETSASNIPSLVSQFPTFYGSNQPVESHKYPRMPTQTIRPQQIVLPNTESKPDDEPLRVGFNQGINLNQGSYPYQVSNTGLGSSSTIGTNTIFGTNNNLGPNLRDNPDNRTITTTTAAGNNLPPGIQPSLETIPGLHTAPELTPQTALSGSAPTDASSIALLEIQRQQQMLLLMSLDLQNKMAQLATQGGGLPGANQQAAHMPGTNLLGANLMGGNLLGANLPSSNFLGTNLPSSNLLGANSPGGPMPGANMMGASLSGANLLGAALLGGNLTGANMTGANMTGANMTGANMTGANMTGANMTGANMTGANIIRANMTQTNMLAANQAENMTAVTGLSGIQNNILPQNNCSLPQNNIGLTGNEPSVSISNNNQGSSREMTDSELNSMLQKLNLGKQLKSSKPQVLSENKCENPKAKLIDDDNTHSKSSIHGMLKASQTKVLSEAELSKLLQRLPLEPLSPVEENWEDGVNFPFPSIDQFATPTDNEEELTSAQLSTVQVSGLAVPGDVKKVEPPVVCRSGIGRGRGRGKPKIKLEEPSPLTPPKVGKRPRPANNGAIFRNALNNLRKTSQAEEVRPGRRNEGGQRLEANQGQMFDTNVRENFAGNIGQNDLRSKLNSLRQTNYGEEVLSSRREAQGSEVNLSQRSEGNVSQTDQSSYLYRPQQSLHRFDTIKQIGMLPHSE